MIQTKTLKEALKDPGVIEVVEELLPEVSATRNGLANKQNVRFRIGTNEEYKWFHLATISTGKLNLLVSSGAASEADKIFYMAFSGHQSASSPYGQAYFIAGVGNAGFKLYSRKEGNKVDFYIHITSYWVSLRIMSMYTDSSSSVIAQQIEAPSIDGLTEIPVQSIGG